MNSRQQEFRVVSFEVVGQDGKGEVVASLFEKVCFAFLFIALLLQSYPCTLLGSTDVWESVQAAAETASSPHAGHTDQQMVFKHLNGTAKLFGGLYYVRACVLCHVMLRF